jgi:hypothetical protein
MKNTNYAGYLYGLVIDANTGKIIKNADVTSKNEELTVVMPFKGEEEGDGIYFATGEPCTYRIETVAANYKTSNVKIRITRSSQRRDVYLDPDVEQSSAAQKA